MKDKNSRTALTLVWTVAAFLLGLTIGQSLVIPKYRDAVELVGVLVEEKGGLIDDYRVLISDYESALLRIFELTNERDELLEELRQHESYNSSPADGFTNVYNTATNAIFCDHEQGCLHEVGHRLDHLKGWISDKEEFRSAITNLIEEKELEKIECSSCFCMGWDFDLDCLLYTWLIDNSWPITDEDTGVAWKQLYAELYARWTLEWFDLPVELIEFYE